LPSAGFCELIHQTNRPKAVGGLSARSGSQLREAKTCATIRRLAEQNEHYSATFLKVSGLMNSLFWLQAEEIGSGVRLR
jgi:hypothetical protein